MRPLKERILYGLDRKYSKGLIVLPKCIILHIIPCIKHRHEIIPSGNKEVLRQSGIYSPRKTNSRLFEPPSSAKSCLSSLTLSNDMLPSEKPVFDSKIIGSKTPEFVLRGLYLNNSFFVFGNDRFLGKIKFANIFTEHQSRLGIKSRKRIIKNSRYGQHNPLRHH